MTPLFRVARDNKIWLDDRRGWWVASEEGKKYFVAISVLGVRLVKPLHRALSTVTGITDGPLPGTKAVEFNWHFTDLTQPIAGFAGAKTGDHEGVAVLREYDDGWRVVDLTLGDPKSGTNSRPFALSEEDIEAGKNIITSLPHVDIVARFERTTEIGIDVTDVASAKKYLVVLTGWGGTGWGGISPAEGNEPFGKELLKSGEQLNVAGFLDGPFIYLLDVRLLEGDYRNGTKYPGRGDPEVSVAVVGKVKAGKLTLSFAGSSGWKECTLTANTKILSKGVPTSLQSGDRVLTWVNYFQDGKYDADRGVVEKVILLRRGTP